jgi:hypothetical protein
MSCSWPVDRSCLPTPEGDVQTAQLEAAENLAVAVLWALSGRQFGECPVIARPCPQSCAGLTGSIYPPSPWMVVWDGANWRNLACGCGPRCSYTAPNVIHLASRVALPITSVETVVINGVVLPDDQYKLEGDLLYRIGADWPAQDLSKELDAEGTWSVTYLRGNPPPPGTDRLVALLAKEFFAACTGGKCRLPRRVQTVSRQGVTYQMVNPTDIYNERRTGLDEIDLWLSSVNPNKLMTAPTVR